MRIEKMSYFPNFQIRLYELYLLQALREFLELIDEEESSLVTSIWCGSR